MARAVSERVRRPATSPDADRTLPGQMVPVPEAAPQFRLVEVARELFCRDGIHATGIDRILAEARVSKMTLYTRYGSKEALVREVLRQEGAAWRETFVAAVSRTGLAGVVDALEPWFTGERFYGCAFMNAVAEHAKGERWLRELAADHQGAVLGFLAETASAEGHAEPEILARQVMLIVDGAIAAFLVSGNTQVLAVSNRTLRAVLARPHPGPLP